MSQETPLRAPLVIEYPFKRTVGPALSAFFTGLREGVIVGAVAGDGRVIVPPSEYDPWTAAELDEIVQVSDHGTVTTHTHMDQTRPDAPVEGPISMALIKLDGADTDLLHYVRADSVSTGMRVQAKWRDEREGFITDIECFEAEQ